MTTYSNDVETGKNAPGDGSSGLVAPSAKSPLSVLFFFPSWTTDLSLIATWASALLSVAAVGVVFSWLIFVSWEKRRRNRVDEELALEKADRQEAEEALYTMAHDLKTPLVTLDHLMNEIDDSHKGHCDGGFDTATEDTRKVLRHMGGLVDQMLSYAQGVAGSTTNGPAHVDQVVQEVTEMLLSECDSRHVRLRVEGGPDTVLNVAPEGLRHILLNLMDNAVKYGPENSPVVRVSWSTVGRGKSAAFVLEVADDGDGVPVELREQVFRLMQRFPDRRGRDLPGSGVGLAVVRRLVHQQGARVEIDDAPEGGALFRVVYPFGLWEDPDGPSALARESSGPGYADANTGPRARTTRAPASLSPGSRNLPVTAEDP